MRVAVTGGTSGLGLAICETLYMDHHSIFKLSHEAEADVHVELASKESIFNAWYQLGEVDCLINCAGVNKIDWIRDTQYSDFEQMLAVNVLGYFQMTKTAMLYMTKGRKIIINIVSNASHIPMTASIAYNACKGAQHIMTLQMARELGPEGYTVFGVSPNKLKGTGMSKYIDETVPGVRGWTPEKAAEYQKSSLPHGKETDPYAVAAFIAHVLKSPGWYEPLHGTVIPYGG